MLYHFSQWLQTEWQLTFFSVFNYLTLRGILTTLTAFVIALLLGRPTIRFLTHLHIGQTIRELGPESHQKKSGTPTMGGLLILLSMVSAILLWANLTNPFIWIVLLVMVGFGVVGFFDDYLKVKHKNSKGLSAKHKYLWTSLIALLASLLAFLTITATQKGFAQSWQLLWGGDWNSISVLVPFLKNYFIPLNSILFVVLAYFVITGTSHAVNLTDGLDGLAIAPAVMVAAGLGIFAYVSGNAIYANYLYMPHLQGVGELIIICAALTGAGLGFLWFNAYPAAVFMGDVGALSIGATLGAIAVLVRQELVLVVMGGVFVMEAISVMLQVGYFRYSKGKRIFRMAPLHHHFELGGWKETQVVTRFWIISFVLLMIGLSTLKIR